MDATPWQSNGALDFSMALAMLPSRRLTATPKARPRVVTKERPASGGHDFYLGRRPPRQAQDVNSINRIATASTVRSVGHGDETAPTRSRSANSRIGVFVDLQQGQQQTDAGAENAGQAGANPPDDDVVDADFEEVKEEK